MTDKKIGCVQHDCDGCKAMDKSLAEEIWLCENQVTAETLAGNTVKEAWWKGRLNGLRTVLAMRSNVKSEPDRAALSPKGPCGLPG
jgi:hypothetical protein